MSCDVERSGEVTGHGVSERRRVWVLESMESYLGWFLLHLLVVCVCVSVVSCSGFPSPARVFALVKHHHSWVVLSKVGRLMEGLIFYLATSGQPGKLAFAEELASLGQNMVFVIKQAQLRSLTTGRPYDVDAFDEALTRLKGQFQQLQEAFEPNPLALGNRPPNGNRWGKRPGSPLYEATSSIEQPEGPSGNEVPLPKFL